MQKTSLHIYFSVFFSFLILIPLTAVSQNIPKDKENYSLLWKIEGKDIIKPSYLFGTMHVRDKRVFEFSDSVLVKFLETDILALEVNFDSVKQKMLAKEFKNIETNLYMKEIYSEEELNLIRERLNEFGVKSENIDKKSPEEINYLLENIEDNKNEKMPMFLDAYLFKKATLEEKEVIGLEKYEDKKRINSTKDKISEEILNKFKNIDFSNNIKNNFIEIYRRGNIDEIWEYSSIYQTENFYQRNRTMVNGLDTLMQNRSVFCAVGVAHLPGDSGLIQMLQAKGYTVSKVPASFTGISDSLIVNKMQKPYQFNDSVYGYSIQTPFRPLSFNLFGGIIDMKICYDYIESPIFYFYAIPATYMGIKGKAKDYYKAIISNFSKQDKYAVNTKKEITHNGVKGIEFIISKGFFKGKIRAFYSNNHMYILMAGINKKHYNSTQADSFFKSFQIFEQKKTEKINTKNWKEYPNKTGAYSIKFPAKPNIQNISIPEPSDTSAIWDIELHSSIDVEKNKLFILRWNDAPAGYYYENDSVVLVETLKGLYGEDFILDKNKIITNTEKGYIYYEPKEPYRDKSVLYKSRLYVRGNRTYFLLAQYNKEGEDNESDFYFNSFELTKYEKTEFLEQNIEGLKIKLPAKPKLTDVDDGTSFLSEGIKTNVYATSDTEKGTSFFINISQYPKYYRFESIDSLYSTYYKNLKTKETHISDSSTSIIDSLYINSGIINSDLTLNKLRFCNLFKDDKYYEIFISGNNNILNDTIYNHILSNMKLNYENKEFDIFSKKGALICKDLQSSDSTTFQNAKDALDYYVFNKDETDLIHKMLFVSYPDSAESWNTVKGNLLLSLKETNNENTIGVLEELYKLNHKELLAGDILSVYSTVPGKKAENIFHLIKDYIPHKIYSYEADKIFTVFQDSIGYIQEILPELANISDQVLEMRYSYITMLSDSSDIVKKENFLNSEINRYIMQWYINSMDSIRMQSIDSASYQHTELISKAILFFKKFNSPIYKDLVLKASTINNAEIKSSVIIYNIAKNIKINKELWSDVFDDDYYAYETFTTLNEKGETDRIPEKYLSLENIALMSIKYDFAVEDYYEDYYTKFKLIKSVSKEKNGKELKYFIYEYSYSDEEEKYLLITGGTEIKDEKFLSDNYILDYYFKPIENKTDRDNGIKELIKKLED